MPAPRRIEPANINEWYGLKIRDLREARDWTQAQLGEAVSLSGGRIAQFERAEGVPPKDIAKLLDEVLGSGGLLVEMRPFLRRNWHQKWPEDIADVETRAARIQVFSYVVPGFLQTREYATALLGAGVPFWGGDLDKSVEVRMERQNVLDGPNQPWLRCIMDESALHRAVCAPDVMRDQLVYLLKMCERPRVTVQVLPFAHNRVFVTGIGLATVWTLSDGRTVVYQEGVNDGGFVTDPGRVSLFVSLYDQLHADALSIDVSMDRIRKALEERHS